MSNPGDEMRSERDEFMAEGGELNALVAEWVRGHGMARGPQRRQNAGVRVFDVELKAPGHEALLYVPGAVLLGTLLGAAINAATRGHPAFIAGMAAGAAVGTYLGLAGANFDQGRRGCAVAVGGGVLGFLVGTAVAMLG